METINTKVNTDNAGKHTTGEWLAIGADIVKNVTPLNSLDNGIIQIAKCYPTIEGNSFEFKHLHPQIEKAFEENPLLVERVITSENAKANASLIVKAVNNHYDLVEALTNMVAFYEGDANLAYIDKAKELLNSLK